MNYQTHLAIASVDVYTIWNNDIYELYQKYHRRDSVWEQLHPWAINGNETANNRPIDAKYYHQFMGQYEQDDNEHSAILFDIRTEDEILQEEINAIGIEETFKDIDFKEIFSNFEIIDYEFRYRRLRPPIYLIIEYTWTGDGEDFEAHVDIIGYLNDKLEKVIWNKTTSDIG